MRVDDGGWCEMNTARGSIHQRTNYPNANTKIKHRDEHGKGQYPPVYKLSNKCAKKKSNRITFLSMPFVGTTFLKAAQFAFVKGGIGKLAIRKFKSAF